MWQAAGEVEFLTLPITGRDSSSRPKFLLGRIPIRATSPKDKPPHNSTLPPLCDPIEVANFSTAKRYEEHLAGRFLLAAILEEWGIECSGIEIQRDQYRAPSLSWLASPQFVKPLPNISIGHSQDWAVAAICERSHRIGIDAEPVDRHISKSAFPFMASGKELVLLNGQSDLALMMWTAKEAVQKALGLGMNLNPRHISCDWWRLKEKSRVNVQLNGYSTEIETWQFGDLCLSLALAIT
jgi:phosphopantetheinyl transferase